MLTSNNQYLTHYPEALLLHYQGITYSSEKLICRDCMAPHLSPPPPSPNIYIMVPRNRGRRRTVRVGPESSGYRRLYGTERPRFPEGVDFPEPTDYLVPTGNRVGRHYYRNYSY